MNTSLKQSSVARQTQKLSANQIASLNILQANTISLYELIRQELEDNFFLEEAVPVDFSSGLPNLEHLSVASGWDQKYQESLKENLLMQFNRQVSQPQKREVAFLIISALNEQGLLEEDEYKAIVAKTNRGDAHFAEHVRQQVMSLDPIGCGALNPHESLLVQAQNRYPEANFFQNAAVEDLLLFSQEEKMRKKFHLNEKEYDHLRHLLEQLSPSPARLYDSLEPIAGIFSEARKLSKAGQQAIIPDIILMTHAEQIELSINDNWLPRLRINSRYFHSLLKEAKKDRNPDLLRQQLEKKYYSAKNLQHAILARRETLTKIVNYMIHQRKDYFLRGINAENEKGVGTQYQYQYQYQWLQQNPIDIRVMSRDLNLSPSTIERAIYQKYIQTRHGLCQGRDFFFSVSKQRNLKKEKVMAMMQKVFAQEAKEEPVPDEQISLLLETQGEQVSRRTVAKYRKELGIAVCCDAKEICQIDACVSTFSFCFVFPMHYGF